MYNLLGVLITPGPISPCCLYSVLILVSSPLYSVLILVSSPLNHFTLFTANKSKVLYGVPRDPIMATALAQLEEEEMESLPDDERPKVLSHCC